MSTLIIIFLIAVIILAIIGMGWSNFLASVFNGIEKVKNSPLVKNITETSKTEVNKIVNSNG
ncbi:MAG TPA: hypothetical protein VN703_08300 [Candidatus Sulfopaludibacter sp.]|jgi:hypothetical protein|nr:hypothetical protein [Candidatus Sulfopaludibacter sp.]